MQFVVDEHWICNQEYIIFIRLSIAGWSEWVSFNKLWYSSSNNSRILKLLVQLLLKRSFHFLLCCLTLHINIIYERRLSGTWNIFILLTFLFDGLLGMQSWRFRSALFFSSGAQRCKFKCVSYKRNVGYLNFISYDWRISAFHRCVVLWDCC